HAEDAEARDPDTAVALEPARDRRQHGGDGSLGLDPRLARRAALEESLDQVALGHGSSPRDLIVILPVRGPLVKEVRARDRRLSTTATTGTLDPRGTVEPELVADHHGPFRGHARQERVRDARLALPSAGHQLRDHGGVRRALHSLPEAGHGPTHAGHGPR